MNSQRVGYIRISSYEQNAERQLDGVALDRVFTDKVSSKDANRPQLEALLASVRTGDTVVVHSMDRFARTLDDLRHLVQLLIQHGVCIEFTKESLTFTNEDSPMANLMLSMMNAFAECEITLVTERQLARQHGAYRGRKSKLSDIQVENLRRRVEAGESKTQIARDYGISRETLYRYLRLTQ